MSITRRRITPCDHAVVATNTPIMIYDGDCGFCTASISFVRRTVRPRLEFAPSQSTDLGEFGISEERVRREVVLVDGAGGLHGGADAFAVMLRSGRARYAWLGLVMRVWPVRPLCAAVYRMIARHRHRLPGGSGACRIGAAGRPT